MNFEHGIMPITARVYITVVGTRYEKKVEELLKELGDEIKMENMGRTGNDLSYLFLDIANLQRDNLMMILDELDLEYAIVSASPMLDEIDYTHSDNYEQDRSYGIKYENEREIEVDLEDIIIFIAGNKLMKGSDLFESLLDVCKNKNELNSMIRIAYDSGLKTMEPYVDQKIIKIN